MLNTYLSLYYISQIVNTKLQYLSKYGALCDSGSHNRKCVLKSKI